MAAGYSQIDLTRLPLPSVVEQVDYESILTSMLADLRSRDPAFSALVESDPAYKILEVCAFRETLIRQRVNDGAKRVMVAYAAGADLDHLAANYGVKRLVIVPADEKAIPSMPAVLESDDDLRSRVVLSLEAYTTAGSRGSYEFHALSASGDVKGVAVTSLTPGTVNVAVLSRTGNGAAPEETLAAVRAALIAEKVRPLCDTVDVKAAQVLPYQIEASLTTYSGVGQAEVLAAAKAAAEQYAASQHHLGRDITRAGVIAALVVPGVQNVSLTNPAADVVVDWQQVAHCSGITVTIGGVGD